MFNVGIPKFSKIQTQHRYSLDLVGVNWVGSKTYQTSDLTTLSKTIIKYRNYLTSELGQLFDAPDLMSKSYS